MDTKKTLKIKELMKKGQLTFLLTKINNLARRVR